MRDIDILVNKRLREESILYVLYKGDTGVIRREKYTYYLWHSDKYEEYSYTIEELCSLIHEGVVILL